MPAYPKTAVSFVNAKETALYFDYVIPLNLGMDVAWFMALRNREPDLAEMFPAQLGSELLPPEYRGDQRFGKQLVKVNCAMFDATLDLVKLRSELPPDVAFPSRNLLDERATSKVHEDALHKINELMGNYDLHSFAVDVPEIFLHDDPVGQDASVALTSMQLVDIKGAPWDHILEFRRSPEAVSKLRRLRLFVYENYQGKDSEYVKDDILQRVWDYEQTIAEWGFETRRGVVAALLSSPFVRGAVAGSFVSSLLGQPLAAILSAAGGIALEVGSIVLELKRRSFELQGIVRENPIVFISDAKHALEEGHPVT